MNLKIWKNVLLVSFLIGAILPVADAENCMALPKMDLWATPSIASKGDTLIIEGKPVQLIGIKAPRLEKKQKFFGTGQPLAPESRTFLNKLIANNKMNVGVVYGKEQYDKFHRIQAYIYFEDGSNAQQRILEAGMAIAMPSAPNTRFSKCLAQAEQTARKNHAGLWGVAEKYPQFHYPIVDSNKLYSEDIGFRVIKGKVVTVKKSSDFYIVNLDTTGIRVPKKYWANFDYSQLQSLKGKVIEVRGFGIQYNRAMFVTINTPYAINLLLE